MSTNTLYPQMPSIAGSPFRNIKADLSRLIQVVTAPREAFDSISRRPKFLLPFLMTLAAVFAANQIVITRFGIGNLMRVYLESHPRMNAIAAAAERESLISSLILNSYAAFSTSLMILTVAAVFSLILGIRMMADWRKIFAVVAHAIFGYFLINSILLSLVMLLREDFSGFDLNNPIASNLAAVINPDSINAFLYSIASSIDILSFWFLFLLATGFSAVVPRLSMRAALLIVPVPWVLYVLAKAGLALLYAA